MRRYRANVYIDGFNLYYGICAINRKDLLWIDLVELMRYLLMPSEELHRIKYFTTTPEKPIDQKSRHELWLDVLNSRSHLVEVFQGGFTSQPIRCKSCGGSFFKSFEKRTDVNIAIQLISDAYEDDFEVAYIVSGDGDFIPAIELLKERFPQKRRKIIFPPNRVRWDLGELVNYTKSLNANILQKFILDNSFVLPSGKTVVKPSNWVKPS